jgi:hypothetical protein
MSAREGHSVEKDATPWHEYTEDVNDGSMCICGVPALGHAQVYPPRDPYSTRVTPPEGGRA